MNRHYALLTGVLLTLACIAAVIAQGQRGTDLELRWHTIDGGGDISFSGDLRLAGTIGQPDATATVSGCPEDLNLDGAVNSVDLTLLLICMNQPADMCGHECDINGDGQCNSVDLTALLAKLGSLCPPAAGGFWQYDPGVDT